MSNTITLTYPEIHPGAFHPGVASASWRNSPGWITVSEIYRTLFQLVHRRGFQITAETITILSIFAAAAVWIFALSSGHSNPV